VYEDRLALSIREAATLSSYSVEAIRKAIRLNKLRAARPGGDGDYRILREDLLAWLRGDGFEHKARHSPNTRGTAAA
jgi:excisionase family DNA binding protein